jgi:hypothetical protein
MSAVLLCLLCPLALYQLPAAFNANANDPIRVQSFVLHPAPTRLG